MRFQGKVVIVTGASRGIGKATAIAFAEEGADLVIAARTDTSSQYILPGTINETADKVRAIGQRALPIKVDVSDEVSVQQMVQQTLDTYGRIDILVNNAAVAFYAEVSDTSPKRWDTVIKVTLRGTFLCSRAVISTMKKQKSGSIINLSSKTADINGPNFVGLAYCSAKAAIERFTNGLAEELRSHNIAVNCIKPKDIVDTEGMRYMNPNADYTTWSKPEDSLVKGILFLGEQDARGITGKIMVDEDFCRDYSL